MCVVELMCTIVGIVLLILTISSGRIQMAGGKEVRGAPAYVVCSLFILVFPVGQSVACGVIGQSGYDPRDMSNVLVDLVASGVFIVPALLILFLSAKPARRKKKKKRRPIEDDYDDRPRRRRHLDDDDDADRPRRRRAADDEDDEDDEPPRRRPRRDD